MTRAIIILLALWLDLTLGDPPNRFHPLLLMGRWLNLGRRLAPPCRRFWFGAGWTVAGALLFALPWKFLNGEWRTANNEWGMANGEKEGSSSIPHPPSTPLIGAQAVYRLPSTPYSLLLTPFLLKPVFAYRNLRRAVLSVGRALESGDLPGARRLLSWHLVSRETRDLSQSEVAGAAIESLAENLTDSLTAPLLAYAIGGLPAAWAYRFINTADAMWGYRTAEFEQLGKFPARLDDALNWLPARLTGWLLVLAARLTGQDSRHAARTMLIQHHRTPSPNAGWTMSAIAGALGVTLDKRGVYRLEGGQGRLDAATIRRALWVADVGASLVVLIAVIIAICRQSRSMV
jgi:adenosylcobinamide-phosphate synthase